MKNKKSLGQIAHDAHWRGFEDSESWESAAANEKETWTYIAKAVERAVKRGMGDGWIHVSERRPTKRDADMSGTVLVWIDKGGVSQAYWEIVKADKFEWWMPAPKAPKKIGMKGRR